MPASLSQSSNGLSGRWNVQKFPHYLGEGSEAAGECVPPLAFIHKAVPLLALGGRRSVRFPRSVGAPDGGRPPGWGDGLFSFSSVASVPIFFAAPSCRRVFLNEREGIPASTDWPAAALQRSITPES